MTSLDDFFVLEGPSDPPWWWLTLSSRAGPTLSPEWRERMRGTYAGQDAVPLKIMRRGKKPGVIGSDTRLCLLSETLNQAMGTVLPTGFDVHPTIVYDKDDETVVDRGCIWLKLQTGCGPLDEKRGRFLLMFGGGSTDSTQEPYGYFFDPASWTGLDVFTPPNLRLVVVTRGIAEAVVAANIEGVRIEALSRAGKALEQQMIGVLGAPKPRHKK